MQEAIEQEQPQFNVLNELSDIRNLTGVLDNVHSRIPKLPKTESCGPPADFDTVHGTISTHINSSAASAINRTLRTIQSTSITMRGLIVSVFYPFGRDDHCWPVVQWTEGDDTEALAIFEVDLATNICSWIIHRGTRVDNESGWNEASIVWSVTHIGQLKGLFHAAQHLFGILEWSSADTHKIYCEGNFVNSSQEEYVSPILIHSWCYSRAARYAQLLIRHFSKIEQVNQAFDRVSAELESRSLRQGTFSWKRLFLL